jgi:tetraacyldisaccharide 4'-kinase
MRAPDFWQRRYGLAAALAPLGWLYNATVAFKARHAEPFRASVPVICVGNLTAGGTGKTPIAIAIARYLAERGRKPFFLTRGHGGRLKGPLRVSAAHSAEDVGDEPLLLAETAPVIVARHREAGARLAVADGAGAIVMDDGHQNFTLHKDLPLVVVDAAQGFGNGRVLPAGPLREFAAQGLSRAAAVILVGDGEIDLSGFAGPVLRARVKAEPKFRSEKIVAFAGIGRPEKFYQSLKECGAEIVATRNFADHHVYSAMQIAALKALAFDAGARLVTTEKDYVRLSAAGREGIAVLPVKAAFDDEAVIARLLDKFVPPA